MVHTSSLDKYKQYLDNFDKLEFNIFEFKETIKSRRKVLPVMTMNALYRMGLMSSAFGGYRIEEGRLEKFLDKIQCTYLENLTYHNDLHGADVMHMTYYMMTNSKLMDNLKLNDLDKLSMIIASACHDLGHDGFTNSYHGNAITQRAISSNDVSIQENYHASEMFRILTAKSTNFLDGISRAELLHFRKRAIQLILATDMSHHNSELSKLK